MKRVSLFAVLLFMIFSEGLKAQCSDFITVGTAMYDGDCLQMTEDSPSQAGCAWQPDKYDFSEPIDVEISANFGTDNGGADGICMVFQLDPAGLSACGPVGGAIAAGGITNSLIIEFDTWENGNFNDPPLDHIAVNVNGDMGNPISPIVEVGNIEDGQDYILRFTWNPLTTSYAVYFNSMLMISGTYDIPANCFGGEMEAYYGFTSSTGAATNNHVICPAMEYVNEFLEAEICEGDSLEVNGEIYTTEGQFTQMLSSDEACDTILFIDLAVNKSFESTSGYAICEGDSINVNGEVYQEAGSYVQEYTTVDGCDSILNINLTLFPTYEEQLDFTINSGETVVIGGEEYSNAGSYVQEYTSNFGCDSIVFINVSVIQNIVYFSLDSCEALIGVSNDNYDEFTPVYPEVLDCGTVSSSILYRNNPEVNLHSCTFGVDGNPTMCVGSLDDCEFDPESDKAVRIDLVLAPDPDSELTLSSLSFFENSPENFNWINGNSGPNNYPTLYGVAIYKNGALIFQDADIPTSNTFSLQNIDFSGEDDFNVTEETAFQVVLLGYCLVGNGSPVAAWDLDEVNINATCSPLPNQNGKISGRVINPAGEPVHYVAIKRTQLKNQPKDLIGFTNADGFYAFDENPGYFSYELDAFKNNEKMKGVTTLDLLMIQKHLLEIQVLDTPEKWIAADLNNSQTITSLDILLLRKLILGIDAEFPEKRSWEFMPAGQDLDLDNPWNYNTVLTIDQLQGNAEELNFTAIKIGDVNNSFSNGTNSNAAVRNGAEQFLSLEDQTLLAGQNYTIPIFAASISSLKGMQFEMDFNGAEILQLLPGQMNVENDQYSIRDNKLIVAWDKIEGIDVQSNIPLFQMEISAHANGKISSFVELSEAEIAAECYYGAEWMQSTLQMRFDEKGEDPANFILGQNRPNPFTESTIIPIEVVSDQTIQLRVYDIQGKLLYKQHYDLLAGQHEISLSKSELNTEGMLFFSVQSDAQIQVRRMMIID